MPFYAVSGSDFVQVYVGVGAARVRELFTKAKKAGRAVIFIDEIDALGKRRDGMSSEEREQTLNALLTQMDGFDGGAGVIVLAATNRVDTLDEALLRPGRFDRHVCVGLPGREQRAKILALHAKDKPFEPSVDWDALAQDTVGFSGAKLEGPAQRGGNLCSAAQCGAHCARGRASRLFDDACGRGARRSRPHGARALRDGGA